MSDDKYRLVVCHDQYGDTWHAATKTGGTHKVVPADAIVIERGDRTAMTEGMARAYVTNALGYTSIRIEITDDVLDRADAHARHLLSAIEYLRANPPVDRAVVASLIQAFAEAGARIEGATFEDLVQAGVRVEVTP